MQKNIGKYALRNFQDSDVKSFVRHANNPNIAKNLRDAFPYPFTEEAAEMWIERAINERSKTDFAITYHNEVIGGIGFNLLDDVFSKSAEIGYWISEDYWGNGIATSALHEVKSYSFKTFDIERIFTGVFSNNAASVRVLEKNGFTFEGCLRKSVYKNGIILDQLVYSILREELVEAVD